MSISNEMSWSISEWRNKKRYNIQTVKISNFFSLNLAPFNSQSDQQVDRPRERKKMNYKILSLHAIKTHLKESSDYK